MSDIPEWKTDENGDSFIEMDAATTARLRDAMEAAAGPTIGASLDALKDAAQAEQRNVSSNPTPPSVK